MNFYDVYLNLCNGVGKTPSNCAVEMGFSKVAVSNWKTRGNIPTDANLNRIANYFGVSVAYLKGEEETVTADGITISPEERKLLELIKALTDDEVKQVSDYLDFIISKRGK